jgi:hypothetical protein
MTYGFRAMMFDRDWGRPRVRILADVHGTRAGAALTVYEPLSAYDVGVARSTQSPSPGPDTEFAGNGRLMAI